MSESTPRPSHHAPGARNYDRKDVTTMTLSRITRAETWTAAGTSLSREKTAVSRHQAVGAFGRDLALASEWHTPADAVAQRLAKTLGEAYGLTTASALVRIFGHHVVACIGAAEADRAKDAPISFIDLVGKKDGRRAFMASSIRDPVETVDNYITERIVTTNLSPHWQGRPARAARGCAGARYYICGWPPGAAGGVMSQARPLRFQPEAFRFAFFHNNHSAVTALLCHRAGK
jgi:hypothetical protein